MNTQRGGLKFRGVYTVYRICGHGRIRSARGAWCYLHRVAVAAAASAALAGCCPISLRPEVTHVSHISQHFQDKYDSSLGYNAAMLDLHIEPVRHLMIDVAEGAVLDSEHHNGYGVPYVGGLMGPREVFSLTVGYDFVIRR